MVVPPHDPPALADAIERLVHAPDVRSAMCTAARIRARDSFGIGMHGLTLQAHYDRLCTGGWVE